MAGMFDKLDKAVERYNEIEQQMTDPEVLADHVRLTELAQERTELQPVVEAYQEYSRLTEELEQAEELRDLEEDADMAELAGEVAGYLLAWRTAGEGRNASFPLRVPRDAGLFEGLHRLHDLRIGERVVVLPRGSVHLPGQES